MLRRIYKLRLKNSNVFVRHSSQVSENVITKDTNSVVNAESLEAEDYSLAKPAKSVLEPLDEDISHVSTYLKPTFNIAAYVNKSDTLQQLLKLGVDFHRIEKKNVDCISFILGLKFDDIKEHIVFLRDLGLETEDIARHISKNPQLLKEDLANLKVRINYLEYKKFTGEMITRIIQANPFLICFSTQKIDEQLGFFQKQFHLSGNEVRLVAVKCPKLITTSTDHVKLKLFTLKEEMGFVDEELKSLILSKPIIFTKGQERILKTFEFVHKTMNIPLERILDEPGILMCRQKRVMERHMFLEKLGKVQYDPKKPNYVSLTTLVSGSDSYFCTEVAKSSVQAYNAFLKSL
ncbi:hypothetical protein NQ315_001062 [Exocentrus adspersus]|uniref:Transcription termination factor 3, mitochondrial n=1 Tax=Exocentrus adspersus TaxID=1586481 RepID=A0AAV8WFP2_9CUCU|nr:hypothetical protein NQ315_001062 [Exocentrus adspersus]